MIEFKAPNKPKIAILLNNQIEITFTTSRALIKDFEALNDTELSVTVKRYSKKRSLSQNAYLWRLLNEIAIKVNRSKEDVYKSFIKDYGVFEILPLKNDAAETFKTKWGKNGLGWFTEDLGESKLKGYTKLIAYYGSSTYTSEEMKRLIDAVVYECNELGINTMSASDIMLLTNDNDT
jgi:hypothetical protein